MEPRYELIRPRLLEAYASILSDPDLFRIHDQISECFIALRHRDWNRCIELNVFQSDDDYV